MNEWKEIESAPKEPVYRTGISAYGPYILAYPVFGEVARVRWWESERNGAVCNFLEDGGNAVRPTHWMPLPAPPVDEKATQG